MVGYTKTIFSAGFLFVFVTGSAVADDITFLARSDAGDRTLQISVAKSELRSYNNSNSSRHLELTLATPVKMDDRSLVVVVVGDKEINCGFGRNDNGQLTTIYVPVSEEQLLVAVTKSFNPSKMERKHPGYKMLVTCETQKKIYTPEEPKKAILKIKNVGETAFTFVRGGRQRGARDNQFAFSAEYNSGDHPPEMLPDIGNPLHFGGMGSFVTLKPQEEEAIEVDLANWFRLDKPGSYSLRCSYYMSFEEMKEGTRSHDTIWEDFACAEFSFSIKKD